ncbi:4'-phosphopantetheinyl transferase HetI [Geobacter sp. OR-1]|uniref:4'-phosphopantetheinyl transferase family protein n=1 Tax=Geobacter sp. OR-1 TaxID=1266765 RepID=UPI00054281C3|nr:4'-phosphopantetheinyl transferase superfamily protein [Geobacter sp. OR-1]GAM09909.1 4'-phosphopantetheinyl transferase HetI [Geobacter sp. OR-1]
MNNILPRPLELGEIHLWLISLDVAADGIPALLGLLSVEERRRAERIRILKPRNHFIVARGLLRKILSSYLPISPEELDFDYGPHGKPELRNADSSGIHFNLSHSSNLALLAINRKYPIGVDIETARYGRSFMKLAERFFSCREIDDLHDLDEESVLAGFYACWTRKEAYLKAIGTGLATPLNAFDVTLKPEATPALVGQRLDPAETERWSIIEIKVPAGYRAAAATQWIAPRIVFRQWQSDDQTP